MCAIGTPLLKESRKNSFIASELVSTRVFSGMAIWIESLIEQTSSFVSNYFAHMENYKEQLELIYQFLLFKSTIMASFHCDERLEALWLKCSTSFVPKVLFFLV